MAAEKKYYWHKIAESEAELFGRGGNLVQVRLHGKDLCLSRKGDQVYACHDRCPHAGGRLHKGWVDALGNIVCPLHQYRFNPERGNNTSGEGYFIKTFPVISNDKGVFVGFEA